MTPTEAQFVEAMKADTRWGHNFSRQGLAALYRHLVATDTPIDLSEDGRTRLNRTWEETTVAYFAESSPVYQTRVSIPFDQDGFPSVLVGDYKPNPTPEERAVRLAYFAEFVLEVLEQDKDWGASNVIEIAGEAYRLKLAKIAENGWFTVVAGKGGA